MRERLVRYLLGELDPADADALEREIEQNPQLSRQLEHLRDCLLSEPAADDPPSGLADRTADSVYDLVLGLKAFEEQSAESPSGGGAAAEDPADDSAEPPKPAYSSSTAPSVSEPNASSPRRSNFTFVDAVVAGGVIMAVGMMLLPALCESREASRRIACKDNLRQIGQALHHYADSHANLFPHVHPGENAGVFAVRLADAGVVDRETLARLVLCRSSPLAERVALGKISIRIPTGDEFARMKSDPAAWALVRRLIGGSYAYRLGYMDGPLYRPIRNQLNSRSPMLSDAAVRTVDGWRSPNHGGCGQNVLFQDNSVSYRSSCFLRTVDDNFFVNAAGAPAAGRGWNDAVLVRSEVTPGVLHAVRARPFRARLSIQVAPARPPSGPPSTRTGPQ